MAVVRAARGDPNVDGQQQEGRRSGGFGSLNQSHGSVVMENIRFLDNLLLS
jgi:hypothetical protein